MFGLGMPELLLIFGLPVGVVGFLLYKFFANRR